MKFETHVHGPWCSGMWARCWLSVVDERRMRPVGGDGAASPGLHDDVPAAPVASVVVAVTRQGDAARISVAGEVDMANAAAVEQQVFDGVTAGLSRVTLDLTALRYIDSAGVWVLFRFGAHLRTAQIAGELLIPADGPVRLMVETAGVTAAIPLRPSQP